MFIHRRKETEQWREADLEGARGNLGGLMSALVAAPLPSGLRLALWRFGVEGGGTCTTIIQN